MLCRLPSWLLCLGSSSLVDEQASLDVQVTSEGTTLVTPPCRQAPMSANFSKSDPVPVNDRVDSPDTAVPSTTELAGEKKIDDEMTTEVMAAVISAKNEETAVAEQSMSPTSIAQGSISSANKEPVRPIDPACVPLPPSIASEPSISSDSSDSSIASDPSILSTPEQTDRAEAPESSQREEAIDKAGMMKRETHFAISAMHHLGFRQIRVLGAGGCGVALAGLIFIPARRGFTKVVVKRTFGANAEANFREEAEFLSACQGQGVVELWGTDPRHRFMSMEHLDYSLHDVIGRGWQTGPYEDFYVPVVDPHQLSGQLLAAIEHVHAKGVIHRDIKPGNVLLRQERDGRIVAKLADFGLACWGTSKTRDLVGTPGFYAPEQLVSWRSGRCRYDEKVDLWCFGATLFELLVGRQLVDPYRSNPIEELDTMVDMIDVDHAAWMRRAPEQWSSLDPKQMARILACTPDRALKSLLHRSLQWGPEERFGAWELLTKFRSMHRPIQRPRPGHGGYRSMAPGQRVLHN